MDSDLQEEWHEMDTNPENYLIKRRRVGSSWIVDYSTEDEEHWDIIFDWDGVTFGHFVDGYGWMDTNILRLV